MLQKLIDHSDDLKRIQNEGYEFEVIDGYGIMSHIPYINSNGEIKLGKLVSNINFQGDVAKYDQNHVINFSGEYPYGLDGKEILGIKHASNSNVLGGIPVNFQFSNKPNNNYKDYYEKFTNYANIISHPAIAKDSTQTAKTFNRIITDEDSVLEYVDTNSSRAEIDSFNMKIAGQKIAIIGLGGTGSYILDLVAKTKVNEIHIFDGDVFNQHNAFRAPGAACKDIFTNNIKKVTYYKKIYINMHKGIIAHDEFINENNLDFLQNFDFVFICIDSGESKKIIVNKLVENKIPFVDSGIGITKKEALNGQVRVSLFSESNYDDISKYIDFSIDGEDVYNTNIQIAEVNSLNAVMAILKWKQYFGMYSDVEKNRHDIYSIETGEVAHEDKEV
ncbi:MAG: ThiF family adenylyltransferase [Clostridia bacterium]|nr:ThiF family adenylyltransferase [Clostridia bacterium]